MDTFEYQVKVPKDRIAVLIGEKGTMKRELEKELGVKLNVDSTEGEVTLVGTDTLQLFQAQDVVKAIARGFNPELAKQLMKTEYAFELMNIQEYAKSKNQAIRLKGRVIGEQGKSRNTLEHLSGTSICVYGKTIGIIGEAEAVSFAKRAVDMLLTGAPHSTVFRVLERWRRDQKRRELTD